MPSAPDSARCGRSTSRPGVHQQRHALAVAGDRRLVAEQPVLLLPPGAEADLLGVGQLDVGVGPEVHLAGVAVDDDGVAVLDQRHDVADAADGRNAERARHDGDVAGRAALLQHQPADAVAAVVEQLRRAHGARHDDRVLGQLVLARPVRLVHQHAQQAVGEIVEVVQPVAQERIDLALQTGAHVALHLLDRRLGRQAVADRLVHAPHPAAVVGEHAVGLQHVAMLAGFARCRRATACRRRTAGGWRSPRRAGAVSCAASSPISAVTTTRGSCRTAWPRPTPSPSAHAGERDRPLEVERDAAARQARQFADRDHLGEHHRRRLQRLDLLLVVGPVRPVLDDQHAERAAGAQDRHAEERAVDFFAGLRQVPEGGVGLRVGQVERPRLRRDGADEALADAQRSVVDRLRLQALGGVEFQHAVGMQHIDRAHLGHHVGRDLGNGLVEPGLRADRLRHDLPQAAEQDARPGGGTPHDPLSSGRFWLTAVGPPARAARRRTRRSNVVEPV